jgi:predicted transposase YbfD/YdcC
VFRHLDPAQLSATIGAFVETMRRELGLAATKDRVVAIDGKSLRRGYERGKSHVPPMMVSVWDNETRFCLAQAGVGEGGEGAAAVALLKSLVLKGAIVTGDALYCTDATAAAIREAGGHYALGLKGNRGGLFAAATAAFAAAGESLPSYTTEERGHDRHETRRASVLPAGRLDYAGTLPGLKAVGRIEATRRLGDGRTQEAVRYVALSRLLPPRKLLEVLRAHWTIENQLHWILDVVFDEDDARTRKDHGPENLAAIRRIAHNILRMHPEPVSMRRKMNLAAWSKEFFHELFTHMR